ncbi:endoplasmic reticulum resident protein 29, partial [Eurytemora carolleeae]|uniref:endoplasmic reticulum resident protein 29 n=1 Tax=Eurytemora carolleeae TaxID=1294199 RepID=UPI000C78D455
NGELGKRFQITKDDYPTVILFVKNNQEGSIDQHRFKDDFTAENLKNFIKNKSGVRLPLQGCIEQYDIFADNFVKASPSEKEKIIKSAEIGATDFESPDLERAQTYIKIMRKLVSDQDFLPKEEKRLNKLLTGKLNKDKKANIEERLNILKSFYIRSSVRDEL